MPTPAETTFVATHEVPVVTAMKPYLNDAREAINLLAPINTQVPVISGSGAVGAPLHATSGVWTGTPYPTLAYQWKADGVNIAGATSANYTPVAGDAGKTITCTVTATNSHGSISATSNGIPIAVVAADTTAPTATAFLPVDNATGVAAGSDLVVTISETVVLGTGVITLKKTSDNSTVKAWNVATDGGSVAGKVEVVGGTALTLHLTSAMANSTEHYVIWDANVVKDAANNPIAAQASTTLWSFTTVASSFTGLLDTYPTASMAYSFRKLRGAYAGSAVRIRRSSDNLEANIGFLANGNFDSAAAAAHIGGGTGFIVTWFDQSGNAIDVTQATAASQPTYSATGMNALPTMTYDGGDSLVKTSVAYTSLPAATTTIMSVMLTSGAVTAIFNWDVNSPDLTLGSTGGSIYFDFANNGATGRVNIAEPGGWASANHLLEAGRLVDNTQFITLDGTQLVSAARTAVFSTGTFDFSVGLWTSIGNLTGKQSELVIWAADLAANRSAARANITAYWLPPAFVGLLDTYPTASMAYSFRKLRNAYAGSAVRIRRSSDNAEANIGFLSNGDFDSAAAATHIGGGSGFIVTWFDQSGNGLDVTNATAANQPTYSATGLLTKPTAISDTSDILTRSIANTLLPATTTTVMVTMLEPNTGINNVVLAWNQAVTANCFALYGASTNVLYFDDGNTTTGRINAAEPSGWNTGGHILEAGREAGNDQFITVDGVELVRASGKTVLPTAATANFSLFFAGSTTVLNISEAVIWAADLAGSRAAARGNVQTYWATPTLLLDVLGVSATRAYSTRKLRAAYAGSAIRIRRSSDNAEQDIGFSGENLDTTAIATFVGSNSAYVVTMYDQSGTGDDATQATAASQPRIVNAGTLDVRNTKAAPLFDGTDDRLVGTSVVSWTSKTIGAVAALNSASPFPHAVGIVSTLTSGYLMVGQNGLTNYIGVAGTPSVDNGTAAAVFGGTLQNVRLSDATGNTTTQVVAVGVDRATPACWVGWIGEVVIFATQLSAPNYATLYTNQQAYWQTGLLLDTLGVTATRAYSTRKLRYAYAGSAIRIRRSSDNAEQDIGFVGENLDTAAITTFVGANSAYVVRYYDQSGNADNVVQATASLQPRIVNAGTLDVRNTKACPKFDGIDDIMASTASFTVAESGCLVATADAGPNFPIYYAAVTDTANTNFLVVGTGGGSSYYTAGMLSSLAVNNGANAAVFGGVLQQIDSVCNVQLTFSAMQFGSDRTNLRYWPGWIGEAVTFAAALSAGNRTAMYTNQKTYWGTP